MKGRAIVIAALCAIAGLAVGVLLTAWIMSTLLNYAQTTSAVATLVSDGAALQKIHSGQPDAATRLLQIRLDGELITIGSAVKEGYRLTPQAREAISQLKALRESSGYAPEDPAVRGDVMQALSLGESR